MTAAMTKSEREDLQRLVRQREKVLKSAARQRSAEMLADFENQMGQEYSFDQDEVWAAAINSVKPLVDKAQAPSKVARRQAGAESVWRVARRTGRALSGASAQGW